MTLRTIKAGVQPNDGGGDNLRAGAQIINENFAELDQRAVQASAQLKSIETGATKNRPDTQLLARANHTGTQLSSTVGDFSPAVKAVVGAYGVGSLDNIPFAGVNLNPDTYRTGGYVVGQFNLSQFWTMTGTLITQAGTNNGTGSQQFSDWGSGRIYSRCMQGGTWGSWKPLMATGDYGVGASAAVDIASADTIAGGGTYRVTNTTPGGPGFYATLVHSPHDSTSFTQLAVDILNGAVWTRRKLGGTTIPWIRQTPEFISNANGSAIKYPDGTMVCYSAAPTKSVTSVPVGAIFSSDQRSFTFPVPFVVEPIVTWSSSSSSNGVCWGNCEWSNTTQTVGRLNSAFSTIDGYLRYIAIGRWK
ncbi:MAG: hypothetical protein ACN6QY_06130 [Pseudomonas sp.]|uniref:pyocin knob domain-containing protein n=1 Tax=Pseudomonas sp. TaxID=306 RepID=UPI003D0BB9D4